MGAVISGEDVVVCGWSCRFPGAQTVDQYWSLLEKRLCAITEIPRDRFQLERFSHPRRPERGKSYTWAAGVLDDVWGFDPAFFGVSPREAQQMDPQQRILLELTWEALEDAGILPSSLSGTDVAVFIGGTISEYAQPVWSDPALAESHFATGNAMAILANRISYIFNFRGPSLTIDTACSSSLVALHHGIQAIRSGRVETAIVGGINVFAAPTSFISFSQANMLSPTGLCRAFSADADGYVRAEGGAILVLRKATVARAGGNPTRGILVASDVNSDGRTNGISLPSEASQAGLLRKVYREAGLSPDRLAFVEAHGTGTPAGDPVEANAIGKALGASRTAPLLIGSVKTNIGHLEAASGLAGVIKAMLALRYRRLPASLHYSRPNPNIDLDALNLAICSRETKLPQSGGDLAGVSSFGFGGTNAHVVVAVPTEPSTKSVNVPASDSDRNGWFVISAASSGALRALAKRYEDRLARTDDELGVTLVRSAAHHRDWLSSRLVITTERRPEVQEALRAYLTDQECERVTVGQCQRTDQPVAFVYSGNASQWPGMGRVAYRGNAAFRARFDEVDRFFEPLSGWSLRAALLDDRLEDRLGMSSIAQPLIFAIQCSTTAALISQGVFPTCVLGHSVGEVAAAQAAGILSLSDSVRVAFSRSKHQERVRETGRMAAVMASLEVTEMLVDEVAGVVVAAHNSPRSQTVAGPRDAIVEFIRLARKKSVAALDLDLDYPFHTELMRPVEAPLLDDLHDLMPGHGSVPFISTVYGGLTSGELLGSSYWWHNVRDVVRFTEAVQVAADQGGRLFIEIGPRGVLTKHIGDTLTAASDRFTSFSVLERNQTDDIDPIAQAVAKVIVSGGALNRERLLGPDPGLSPELPSYPWQHTPLRYNFTSEGVAAPLGTHPLAGTRCTGDSLEWRSSIDSVRLPALADHRLGDDVVLPGTGFLEIALAAATQWVGSEMVMLADFETLSPLHLGGGESREILTRISSGSRTFEISSRPRLSQAAWTLHCRGKIYHGARTKPPASRMRFEGERVAPVHLYAIADSSGLHYGPAFRLVKCIVVRSPKEIVVELKDAAEPGPFLIDPVRLDACCHGVILRFPSLRAEQRGVAYIPVRIDQLIVHRVGAPISRARISILKENERSILTDIIVFSDKGEPIATLRGVRCQAVPVRRPQALESVALVEALVPADLSTAWRATAMPKAHDVVDRALRLIPANDGDDQGRADWLRAELLLDGWATAVAYEFIAALTSGVEFQVGRLVEQGLVPAELEQWFNRLLAVLEKAELASVDDGLWALCKDDLLPRSVSVVAEIATQHPERAAELLIAAKISALAERTETTPLALSLAPQILKSSFEFYDSAAPDAGAACHVLGRFLNNIAGLFSSTQTLRVLQIGADALTKDLFVIKLPIELTILEPDTRKVERLKAARQSNWQFRTIAELDDARYDLIVTAERPDRFSSLVQRELDRVLAHNGLIIALDRSKSAFSTIVEGLRPESGSRDASTSDATWRSMITAAGIGTVHTAPIGYGAKSAELVVAESNLSTSKIQAARRLSDVAAATVPRDQRTVGLANAFKSRIVGELQRSVGQIAEDCERTGPPVVVHFVSYNRSVDHVDALTDACLDIRATAERLNSGSAELWLIFQAALPGPDVYVDPVQAGAWAFTRTLANELVHLTVRRVDLASDLDEDEAVARLITLVRSPIEDTEIQIASRSNRVVRVSRIERARRYDQIPAAPAVRLEETRGGGQRMAWRAFSRRLPAAGELEIEVAATGLNFRDVMRVLGLLPDDLLESGFSGPTLGLECAGTVIAVGPGVNGFVVGDRVMTLAANAFASHVTVSARMCAKVPSRLSLQAAATIPVAFITAYYSLVSLAQLARGEHVLVHGGAGGVGLAALQVARYVGAEVIATAGAEPKRDLLRALGVSHVLDSRSIRFVEEIHEITEGGVDVVLNSLAGEAMERSISCLRSFGRFVELGKRDFALGTHIGLRPFRRNLSYFGVDVDQFMAERPRLGRAVFEDVVRRLEDGAFGPPLHSVFPATALPDAFNLLQHSSHVGKIVIEPPDPATVRNKEKPFTIDSTKTHLVSGGLGGFGLATAEWLVDRGARYLVLVGRSGAATPESRRIVDGLRQRGVDVLAEACDISDPAAVSSLLDRVRNEMPPLAGVIHSAMVLDDAILANLTRNRFDKVLRPKVSGAINLDRLTREQPLDYFVLFSSVVTLIGNRGQGSYVAANAYLEGLARRRRKEGLPALAIGWGPIVDVGVVARTERMRTDLKKIGGVRGMTAREALDLMGQALGHARHSAELAVMTIAPHEQAFSAELLPLLRAPMYRGLGLVQEKASESERTDLREFIGTNGAGAARELVARIVRTEIARVLLLQDEEVQDSRPLSELGLDSLMAIELALTLEERLAVHLSLRGTGGDLTVRGLVEQIIALVETPAVTHDDSEQAGPTPQSHDGPATVARDAALLKVASKHRHAEQTRD